MNCVIYSAQSVSVHSQVNCNLLCTVCVFALTASQQSKSLQKPKKNKVTGVIRIQRWHLRVVPSTENSNYCVWLCHLPLLSFKSCAACVYIRLFARSFVCHESQFVSEQKIWRTLPVFCLSICGMLEGFPRIGQVATSTVLTVRLVRCAEYFNIIIQKMYARTKKETRPDKRERCEDNMLAAEPAKKCRLYHTSTQWITNSTRLGWKEYVEHCRILNENANWRKSSQIEKAIISRK